MKEAFEDHSIMRCPVCFAREIDVLMLQEQAGEGRLHYCVKCGFKGPEPEVRAMYKDIQKKFHWNTKRFTVDQQREL